MRLEGNFYCAHHGSWRNLFEKMKPIPIKNRKNRAVLDQKDVLSTLGSKEGLNIEKLDCHSIN